jgi:hypothetical protein
LNVFQRHFNSLKPLVSKLSPGEMFSISPTMTSVIDDSIYRTITDLEEKIKIFENRVVGAGVQMGGIVFQSFEDLLA